MFTPGPGGTHTKTGILAPVLVKGGETTVVRVFVNKIPTVDGGVYNSPDVASISNDNLIAAIPAGSRGVLMIDAQIKAGLVVDPGTGGLCAVTYT